MNAATSYPHIVRIVFSSAELQTDARRLRAILIKGGEDPACLGLDELVLVAIRQRSTAIIYQADALGIEFHNPEMTLTPQGDAHILFGFDNQTEATAFKLKFG